MGSVQLIDYNGSSQGFVILTMGLSGASENLFVPIDGTTNGLLALSGTQIQEFTDQTSLAQFTLGNEVDSVNLQLVDTLSSDVHTFLAQGAPNTPQAQFTSTIIYDYTPAPPLLSIQTTTNGVVVYWPNSATQFRLQQSPGILITQWQFNTNSVDLVNGTNQVSISPDSGAIFFRLIYP